MQQNPHIGVAQLQNVTDILQVHLLQIAQREHRALIGAQTFQGAVDTVLQLRVLEQCQRRVDMLVGGDTGPPAV